jgi:hypothetical protein
MDETTREWRKLYRVELYDLQYFGGIFKANKSKMRCVGLTAHRKIIYALTDLFGKSQRETHSGDCTRR